MKYKQKPDFILRDIAGDKILIPRGVQAINFSATIVFNETAVLIWNFLSEEKSFDSIVELLISKYDIPLQSAQNDVRAFLEKGEKEGIIYQL